jgi:general secretion pathway protein F
MSRFGYAAVLDSGQRVRGTIRSRTPDEAARKLLEMGYHPLHVSETAADDACRGRRRIRFAELFHRISTSDLAVMTRQLATLLKAGMPMLQVLGTLRGQSINPRLGAIVAKIEETLLRDAGLLSDVLDEYPGVFGPVYRGLVRSGEASGTLPEVLGNLARHLGASAKLRGQVAGAFVYPAFLLLMGSSAMFVLMTWVIPRFQALFETLGQDLPWPTEVLIVVSHFMAGWWWAVLAAGALATAVAYVAFQNKGLRARLDRWLLRAPLIGPLLLKVEVARISHTLAALLNSGVPILEVLRATRETAKNRAIRGTFDDLLDGVVAGDTVASGLAKSGLYPAMMVNLVRTGEETGELPAMLAELAAIYEDEAERTVTATVKLLEPVLILVMGLVIAGIVAAVILPIFRANTLVAKHDRGSHELTKSRTAATGATSTAPVGLGLHAD